MPDEPLVPQPSPRPWPLAPEPEPLFGLGTVGAVLIAAFVALIVCGGLALMLAHHMPGLSRLRPADLADDPRVLLPAQLAAYILVLAGLGRWFGRLGVGFSRGLCWNWPARWQWFVAGGAVLGIAIQFVSNWLPSPPELPIDKMLRTATDAWLMTGFGVVMAPIAEEVFFRGLLFPALSRRVGAVTGLLLTSLLFGAAHADQLGDAWSQVACIVAVGAALTLVRWRFHSLAASTLVHMGYNGVLFATLFVQTQGFTHLS